MVSLILILFVAAMIPGVIVRTRAALSGRQGIPFYQHLNNVGVQLQKAPIYSPVSGLITRAAPMVYLGTLLTAALLIPVGGLGALLSFEGNIVLFCYLLAASRLTLILAAMDAGSSFEGMGASREALYGALIEPALFLVLGSVVLISEHSGFESMWGNLATTKPALIIVMFLLMCVLFMIVPVEAGRIPVDDPRTHLELTMIHEVMVLDYSGFDLALITIGGWIKTALLAIIGASLLCGAVGAGAPFVAVLATAFGLLIGILESLRARNRLSANITYIVTMIVIGFILFIIAFVVKGNIAIG